MSILYLVYLIPVVLVTCSQHTQVFATQFQDHGNAPDIKNLPCPVAGDIAPCICTYLEDDGVMDMDCTSISDEQELHNVFHADLPFTHFRKLTLGTSNLKTLSDTVFGDATFVDVRALTGGGTLTSVGSKTFIKSASTLKVLYLHHNQLPDFPFETLSQYTQLQYFSLYNNPISIFPVIQSDSLRVLYMGHAAYNTIPAGALDNLPNLEYFYVRNMNVGSMATELFSSLPKMRNIFMSNIGLEHLKALQFAVTSTTIDQIDLHANQITTVDADTFKGVQSGTINLIDNQISMLPEATWRPVIDAGVHLQLKGNSLTCGCDVAWLVLEPTYHTFVEDAVCKTGEMLEDLDPSFFENFC